MPKSETIGKVHFGEYAIHELADVRSYDVPKINRQYLWECDPSGSWDLKWRGGIASWADAEDLLNKGWAEGSAKALALKDEIMTLSPVLPKVRRNKRIQTWGMVGHSLNVDRALNGDYERAWRATRRELVQGGSKCVTLSCGWGGNCELTAEQLFWSGATMLVMADMLTSAGYSVRINAVNKIRSNAVDKLLLNRVVIKDHNEPLRPDALAAVICHAGIYRTFGFRASLLQPFKIGPGLGRNIGWAGVTRQIEGKPEWWECNEIIVKDACSKGEAIQAATEVLQRFAE